MTLEDHIRDQRIKHIISSYRLDGDEVSACSDYLDDLLSEFAPAAIELAFAETILKHWTNIPIPRGLSVFQDVRQLLEHWEATTIDSLLTADEFQGITGLDPSLVFGPLDSQPPSCRIVRS